MSAVTALVAIRCPRHGATMEQRPAAHQTPEQLFCGAWWDCIHRDFTTLFQSAELRAQLAGGSV